MISGTFVTQWNCDALDRPMWMRYPGGNGGQAGVWYTLTLVVDDVRGLSLEVRPATDPAKRYTYNLALATGKQWRFHAWTWTDAAHGSLYLDDYREFSGGAVVTPDERLTFGYMTRWIAC